MPRKKNIKSSHGIVWNCNCRAYRVSCRGKSIKPFHGIVWSCGCGAQEGLPEDGDGARHLKVDVFAFGVTLWEMLTRQRPHHSMEGFEIQARPPRPRDTMPRGGP